MLARKRPRRQLLPRHHDLDAGMRPGHRVALHTDPYLSFMALIADLDAARTAVTIELYMLLDDHIGEVFVAALARAARRDVRVRLTLDGVGSLGLPRRVVQTLTEAGVHLQWHAPLALSLPWRRWMRRNHRKIFLIDGEVVWTQGMNIGRDYYALQPDERCWADAGVRIEGPLCGDVAAELHVRRRKQPAPEPELPARGEALAAVAFNRGGVRKAETHRRYLGAVRHATSSILLAQSYFLPEHAMMRALGAKGRAGLDVRVLMPAIKTSDVVVVSLASLHAIGHLLRHGVRVFAMQDRMLHAKFGVVDGRWWTLGSSNLDPLSRQRNLEANAVGVGATEAQQLTTFFDALCLEAREITLVEWHLRPRWQRVLGAIAWWFRGVL